MSPNTNSYLSDFDCGEAGGLLSDPEVVESLNAVINEVGKEIEAALSGAKIPTTGLKVTKDA